MVKSIQRNGHSGVGRSDHIRPSLKAGMTKLAKGDASRLRHEFASVGHDQHRYHHFHNRLNAGGLNPIFHGKTASRIDLSRQYRHHHAGDVTRQLALHHHLRDHGAWRREHHYGRVSNAYTSRHFGHSYCGPSWYPRRVWWPHWTDWVRWCLWDYCHPIYDPRPHYCRPIVYHSCSPIVVYDYPRWEPLYAAGSGTWVDVPEVAVGPQRHDLQLLAVRFVDAGHPEEQLGPRFRVWVRNNSEQAIPTQFNVSVIASNDDRLSEGLPQAGMRVESINAGQTQSVDLRLPWAVYDMNRDPEGRPAPFAKLHAIVDSHGEISETSEANNGVVLKREEILPVDPAAFSTDVDITGADSMVSIAGEGFGPEPGQVLMYAQGLELEPEIHGWYDLGVRIKIPELPLVQATEAELVVVRGDSAASNPLKVTLAPKGAELLPAP